LPTQALQTIPLTWPFTVLGLDMVGPLKKALGGFTHLLIMVDKFTKWIEAKPITKTNSQEAVKFFLDIIYRFGVPNIIITDNGTTFTGKKFLEFADGYRLRSTGHRSGTHALMGGLKGQMEWSSKDSNLASLTSSKSSLGVGSRSSQPFSGA
jgi:hypothetical protein